MYYAMFTTEVLHFYRSETIFYLKFAFSIFPTQHFADNWYPKLLNFCLGILVENVVIPQKSQKNSIKFL